MLLKLIVGGSVHGCNRFSFLDADFRSGQNFCRFGLVSGRFMTLPDVDETAANWRNMGGGKRKLGRPTLNDEALLKVAIDLFLEHGFERTTFDAVANAAGMAKRTLYARFPDKDALFRAALTQAIEKWILPANELQKLETDDLEATLVRLGDKLVSNVMSEMGLGLFRLTNSMSSRMPEIAASNVQQGVEPTVEYLYGFFARRLDLPADSPVNAREAAHAFIHLVVGGPSSMAAWGVTFDQAEIDRHTRSSVSLFLHGVLQTQPKTEVLEDENRRLRNLLTDALLVNEALKEQVADA